MAGDDLVPMPSAEVSKPPAVEQARGATGVLPPDAERRDEEGIDTDPSSRSAADARRRKAVARAERRTAKDAARQLAALEKREARERKALAKAAARRRGR